MMSVFEVGALVRSRSNPDWGLGQVQSNVRGRITVTFEHAGKIVLADGFGELELVSPDWQ